MNDFFLNIIISYRGDRLSTSRKLFENVSIYYVAVFDWPFIYKMITANEIYKG